MSCLDLRPSSRRRGAGAFFPYIEEVCRTRFKLGHHQGTHPGRSGGALFLRRRGDRRGWAHVDSRLYAAGEVGMTGSMARTGSQATLSSRRSSSRTGEPGHPSSTFVPPLRRFPPSVRGMTPGRSTAKSGFSCLTSREIQQSCGDYVGIVRSNSSAGTCVAAGWNLCETKWNVLQEDQGDGGAYRTSESCPVRGIDRPLRHATEREQGAARDDGLSGTGRPPLPA